MVGRSRVSDRDRWYAPGGIASLPCAPSALVLVVVFAVAWGLFGAGPGEGVMKFRLPEPHTDYIFSVIGEEFGILACLAIAGLYLAFVARVYVTMLDEEDPFLFLAATGLATQFGLQATINMMVNLKLLPSKGMTLPFISHGGSSFIALCMGMGLLLALTRRNPYRNASPYAERWRA